MQLQSPKVFTRSVVRLTATLVTSAVPRNCIKTINANSRYQANCGRLRGRVLTGRC